MRKSGPIVLLLCLLGGCFPDRTVDDPTPFLGCYAAGELIAKVNESTVWLSNPGQTLPAHVGEDKHGHYLLVERPVWYRYDAAGNLELAQYKGTGTYFRFVEDPPGAVLEVPVRNGDFIRLPKVPCEPLGLT